MMSESTKKYTSKLINISFFMMVIGLAMTLIVGDPDATILQSTVMGIYFMSGGVLSGAWLVKKRCERDWTKNDI